MAAMQNSLEATNKELISVIRNVNGERKAMSRKAMQKLADMKRVKLVKLVREDIS